jgi:hypothetical protein
MIMLIQLAAAACAPDLDAALSALEATTAVYAQSVEEAVACQPTPMTPTQAARAHGLLARAADATGDADLAARHLLAAWEAQPFVSLPRLSDAAHRALERLQEAPAAPQLSAPAPRVDGSPSTWQRAGQPAWVQADGRAATLSHPEAREARSPLFLVAGLVSAGVSAGLYAGAWQQRGRYDELISTGGADADRERAHATTNGLSVGAVVGAAASAGLLVVHIRR